MGLLGVDTISCASIINFLERMRCMGVLSGKEVTGKGGHYWIYSYAMSESEFKRFIASTILSCLMRDFPEETKKALTRLS